MREEKKSKRTLGLGSEDWAVCHGQLDDFGYFRYLCSVIMRLEQLVPVK